MIIVTDCNVIISAGLTNGTARKALMNILSHNKNFISDEIVREYRDVMLRPKFTKYKESLVQIIEHVCINSHWISYTPARSDFHLPDPFDQMYLDLAIEIKADYIVTGNAKDYPDFKYNNTVIISPGKFI